MMGIWKLKENFVITSDSESLAQIGSYQPKKAALKNEKWHPLSFLFYSPFSYYNISFPFVQSLLSLPTLLSSVHPSFYSIYLFSSNGIPLLHCFACTCTVFFLIQPITSVQNVSQSYYWIIFFLRIWFVLMAGPSSQVKMSTHDHEFRDKSTRKLLIFCSIFYFMALRFYSTRQMNSRLIMKFQLRPT